MTSGSDPNGLIHLGTFVIAASCKKSLMSIPLTTRIGRPGLAACELRIDDTSHVDPRTSRQNHFTAA